MKLVSTEDLSPVAKRLTVEIEQALVAKALDKAYKRLSKTARLKGFRTGKVPRPVLERYYGDQLTPDVIGQLIQDSVPEAIESSELTPVVQPKVEPCGLFDPKTDFQYYLDIEIAPEFEVKNYLGLDVVRKEREINDKTIQAKLEEISQVHATLEAAPEDRKTEKDDSVLVDIKVSTGETIDNFDIRLGSGRFHEDVEKALTGQSKGAKIEVKAEFPTTFFHDALAGKEAELSIDVKEIRTTVVPEINDDFAQSLGADFKNLDDLTAKIKEEMVKATNEEAERSETESAMDQLIEATKFEVPDGLVEHQLKVMVEQLERSLTMQGLNMPAAGIDPQKLSEDLRPQALRRCQEDLILAEIAKAEALAVEDDDLTEAFEELAVSVGQTVEEVRKIHNENNMMDSFSESILRRKTLKRIIAKANIKIETITEDDAK